MLKIAASSGIAMTPPRKRGITTRRTGSTAIISIADKLVGGAHQPELRGERRARAPGEQQRRDHRAEFLQQAERDRRAERFLRTESLEQVEALQAEHHADEQARQHDDHERQRAGVVDLLDHQAEAQQRTRRLGRESAREQRVAAERTQRLRAAVGKFAQDAVAPFRSPAAPARRIRAPDSGTAPARPAARA